MIQIAASECQVKAGDVFYHSWGYDQTNYEFAVVVKVSPSGKVCWVKKCGAIVDELHSSSNTDALVPTGQAVGEIEYRMKVGKSYTGPAGPRSASEEPELIGRAWMWETAYWGKARLAERFQQTAFGCGH